MAKKDEIAFLEEYYKFFSKTHPNDMETFVEAAEKTLVDTGQISEAVLKEFKLKCKTQIELDKKCLELEKLKKEIEDLKRKSSSNSSDVDPCGRGGKTSNFSHC